MISSGSGGISEVGEHDDESLDIVHDHFTPDHRRLVRQMTKDWEVGVDMMVLMVEAFGNASQSN